jgi:hypothetical protein
MVVEDVHYMQIGVGRAPVCTLGHHVEAYVATEHLKGLPPVEEQGLATALRHRHYNRGGVWPDALEPIHEAYLNRWQPGAPVGLTAEQKQLKPLDRPCRPDRLVVGKGEFWRFSAAEYFHWCVDACLKHPETYLCPKYLTWKARVDQRRADIEAQGGRADVPPSWIRRESSA